MPFTKFLLHLFIVTIVSLLFHFLMVRSDIIQPYTDFSLMSIVFFICLCFAFFFMGQIVSQSKNLYLFNGLVAFIVISKMTFCTLFIIIYFKKMHPADKFFVVPFFLYYILYTIFELQFMSKFARKKVL